MASNILGGIASNILGGLTSGISGFAPNPLGNFNTYSPNIDITISPESFNKSSCSDELPPGVGITIASTGKTANFYIERMLMESTPLTTQNSISTIVTAITAEIMEPMGFTFFDKYFHSVAAMGWKLATEAIIYVTVSFNGWSESGAPIPRSYKTTWRCRLTDIKVETESSGSKYTISLVPIDTQEGLDSLNHMVDRSCVVEIKEKFEDSLKELEKVYNETGTKRDVKGTQGEPDRIYEFRVGPKLLELNPKMPVKIQSGTTTVQLGPDGKAKFTVTNGDTISDMLIKYAGNIIDIGKELNPKVDDNMESDPQKPAGNKLAKFFTVHPEVCYSKFDTVKNRYVRNLRYTIDLAVRPDLETQPPNVAGSKARAMAYIKEGILKKRYDYIFTGQNTEVLEFKMDFNPLYSQMVSSYTLQSPEALAPNIDEESRKAEQGLDLKILNGLKLPDVFGALETFGGIVPTTRLMETMSTSSTLAGLLNLTFAPTVPAEFLRSGVSVPKDRRQAKSVDAVAEMDAKANARNAYAEFTMNQSFMTQIKIGVRGDPYWLGATSVNYVGQNANFYSGSQYIYFNFKLAEPHNEQTGLSANLGKITFSGIYNVTHIQHIFDGGKFTQFLECVIDPTLLAVEL